MNYMALGMGIMLMFLFAPTTGATTQDCATGTNAAVGYLNCTFHCDISQQWTVRVDAHNNGGYVRGQQSCGGASSSCGYGYPAYDTCSAAGGWTSSHSHSGSCWGEQVAGDRLGLSVQCYLSAGSWTSGVEEDGCEDALCFTDLLHSYLDRTTAELDGPVGEFRILSFGGATFGFACEGQDGGCVEIDASCTRSAEAERCQL